MKSRATSDSRASRTGLPVLLSLLFLALVAIIGCGEPGRSRAEAVSDAAPTEGEAEAAGEGVDSLVVLTEQQISEIGLAFARAERRPLRWSTTTTGSVGLDPSRVAEEVSRVRGWVEELKVHPQDPVETGDTLAVLYSPDFLAAQADLLQARRQVESVRSAGGDSTELEIARSLVGSARRKMELLGGDVGTVERVLQTGAPVSYLVLRSPLDGRVLESRATRGGAVAPGDPLFRLADVSRVWVAVDFYEPDLRFAADGDRVSLAVGAFPNDTFPGRITRIGAVLDPETGTVKARAVVPNPGGRLRPGMFGDVRVRSAAEGTGSLVVPEAALQQIAGEPIVFERIGEGRFLRRQVRVGLRQEGVAEILGGLDEGEEVVTRGSFTLKSELLKGTFAEDDD